MWRIIVSLLVIECEFYQFFLCKYNSVIIMIFIKNILVTLSNARIDCPGINEEYKECGRRCEKTCDNLNSIKSCSVECVSGCFCRPGTVRNQFYQCVPIPECRMPEGENFIYICV